MLVYIPAPWIRHGEFINHIFMNPGLTLLDPMVFVFFSPKAIGTRSLGFESTITAWCLSQASEKYMTNRQLG